MASILKQNLNTTKLNTGVNIPVIGLGTWKSTEEMDAYNSVKCALENGYRHIDTAAIYKNEIQVGKAINDFINESGVTRDKIFVTTKLWGTQHRDPTSALNQSLERLGLEYVDLYLIHWPVSLDTENIKGSDYLCIPFLPNGKVAVDIEEWNFVKTWELMQELVATGKTKAIGISNFSINNIKELLSSPSNKIIPAVNQIEVHPLLPQDDLIKFCEDNSIAIEAYSPLGGSDAPILNEKVIIDIAEKHNVTPAQVVISWHAQRGYVCLPKSVKKERIISNQKTFILPDEDFAAISNLSKEKGEKRIVSFDFSPFDIFA